MITHIDEYIDFCLKNELTTSQFLLLYLLETQDKKNIEKINKTKGGLIGFKDEEIKDLIEKGHILQDKVERKYTLENLVVSLEYKEVLFKNPYNAAKEIWDAYPPFQIIDGNKKPSRNIDFDAFVDKYKRIVGKSILEHFRILRITKQIAEREKYAYFGIDKYISTRAYESYELKYAEQSGVAQREII